MCMGGDKIGNRRECERCGAWLTKGNYARHVCMYNERPGEGMNEDRERRSGQGKGEEMPAVRTGAVPRQYGESPKEL